MLGEAPNCDESVYKYFKKQEIYFLRKTRSDYQFAMQPDVNSKDQEGHTALYHAVEANNVAMVEALLSHGANPALEAELERKAQMNTEIGEMLLTALQPTLEANSEKCPRFKEISANSIKRHQSVASLDQLQSQKFPIVHVEVLNAIPPVGPEFSLSPDGKWLVVRENHQKTPQEKS